MYRYLIFILSIILVLSLFTTMYVPLSIALSIVVFYSMLNKFGKGIVLLETMAIYACVIYLLMPSLGYSVYNTSSRITVLWNKQMAVPFDTYFSYVLPAIAAYVLGLFLINSLKGKVDEGPRMMELSMRIKERLKQPSKKGTILVIAGICFYFVKLYLSGPLSALASFGYLLLFPGVLYLYFQPKAKWKKWVYILVIGFLARDAINTGMFTIFFYMSLTIVSFFLLGRKIRFPVKLGFTVMAICSVFVLQLVKGSFRKTTWGGKYTGSKAELFQDLFIEQAAGFNQIFSEKAFFPIYVRLNQGWTVTLVMNRIPSKQPFDEGESIFKTVAASVVPRILWPDKPQSGGIYNMQHFAGFKLRGWSTNVGPVGEAYGNFGPHGGIVYMFFFGLFIGWAYFMLFKISRRNALMLLWMPLLFFEVMYSMENDTLQALNSLVKAAVFMWLLYKLFPSLFIARKNIPERRKNNENRDYLGGNGTGRSVPGQITS